jgi:L-2-hydroxycarboxylate dehydrogenase (NAD+)
VGEGTGHFFGAMRIDAFQPADVFKAKMDEWIQTFRAAKPVAGREKVLIPGDPEREKEIRMRKEGIPILPAIAKDLKEIAREMGLEFELRE